MFYLYILYSSTKNKYYVGQTENIETRVEHHNSGISRYTSITNDWILVYSESFETRNESIKRENEIKRKKAESTSSG
jgi:putative endonuclease